MRSLEAQTVAATDRRRRFVSLLGALLVSAFSLLVLGVLWVGLEKLVYGMPSAAISAIAHVAWAIPLILLVLILPTVVLVAVRSRRTKLS